MSGHPWLGLADHIGQRSMSLRQKEVPSAPGTGLILERARKGRGDERPFLADILLDRGLEVPTSQRRPWSFG